MRQAVVMRWCMVLWAVLTGAAAATDAARGVTVTLDNVRRTQATLRVTKTDSNATQVVANLTGVTDVDEFQQKSVEFNTSIPLQTLEITFTNLTVEREYRVCSNQNDDLDTASEVSCFKFTTFPDRSNTKAIIAAVVASCVFLLVVALVCLVYKAIRRNRHSKTMIVNATNGRSAGVENGAAEIPTS